MQVTFFDVEPIDYDDFTMQQAEEMLAHADEVDFPFDQSGDTPVAFEV